MRGMKEEQNKQNEFPASKNNIGKVEEQYLKPFQMGWKREVVMRVVTVSFNCDIYYVHPSGKKLRSMAEIKSHLTDGLTPECFTFKKKPLNVSAEIVRKASVRGHHGKKSQPVKKIIKSNSKTQIKKKAAKLKKVEKPNYKRVGTQRQRLIKKKEHQRNILEIKKLKKSKPVQRRKVEKTGEKTPKETSNNLKSTKGQSKSENKDKPAQSLKLNGVQCKVSERATSSQRLKSDNGNVSRKCDCNDIRSIVQRNIGKYRELRKKQLKSGLRERAKKSLSYKSVRRRMNSEPLSKNMDIYLKPLEKGWRRELVYRVNGPDAAGRSDVYYFHPNGKKLRSTREIADNLTQGLTIDCFTFRREALGCGEPFETVRNARLNKIKFLQGKKVRHDQ